MTRSHALRRSDPRDRVPPAATGRAAAVAIVFLASACLGAPQARRNTPLEEVVIEVPDDAPDPGPTGTDSLPETGGAGGPDGALAPELDLGTIAEGCAVAATTVSATDRLSETVELTTIAWSPTDPADADVVTPTLGVALPITVAPGDDVEIAVAAAPVGAPRTVTGRLVAVTSAGDTVVLRRVTVTIGPSALQRWTRAAAPPPPLDLLLVLSDRLQDAKYWESTLVLGDLTDLVETLDRWGIAYGITTARSTSTYGARVGSWVTPDAADPVADVLANVARVHRGSTRDVNATDPTENVLASTRSTITGVGLVPTFSAVVRDGADLVALMITADDDLAGLTFDTDPPATANVVEAVATASGVHPHRFVGTLAAPRVVFTSCTTPAGSLATAAPRIRDAIGLASSTTVTTKVRDICVARPSQLFTDVLDALYGEQATFPVPTAFDDAVSRAVTVDGVEVALDPVDGWIYDQLGAVLRFAPSATPGPAATVEATWTPAGACPP